MHVYKVPDNDVPCIFHSVHTQTSPYNIYTLCVACALHSNATGSRQHNNVLI